jgi:hypothetical protein
VSTANGKGNRAFELGQGEERRPGAPRLRRALPSVTERKDGQLNKSWLFRFAIGERERKMGLGSFQTIGRGPRQGQGSPSATPRGERPDRSA